MLWRAMRARRSRRISSSVLPLNMEPVMTSIEPVVCFMDDVTPNERADAARSAGASALMSCFAPARKPGGAGARRNGLLGGGRRLGLCRLGQEAARAQALLQVDQALAAKAFQAQQRLIAAGQPLDDLGDGGQPGLVQGGLGASAQLKRGNWLVGRGLGGLARGGLGAELVADLQLLIEPIHLAFGVDHALLTGVERVALRAHVGVDHFFGGAGVPGVAARANDRGVREVLGMNTVFHSVLCPKTIWALRRPDDPGAGITGLLGAPSNNDDALGRLGRGRRLGWRFGSRGCGRRRCRRHDADLLAAVGHFLEGDLARGDGVQGVVAAEAHVQARVNVGAALARDDVTRLHPLAAKLLDAQALRIAVATVAAGTRTFFMCHVSFYPSIVLTIRRVYVSRWPRLRRWRSLAL